MEEKILVDVTPNDELAQMIHVDRSQPGREVGLIGNTAITVEGGRLFQRCGIRIGLANRKEKGRSRWLVAELDGVKLYCFGPGNLLMTKEEIHP